MDDFKYCHALATGYFTNILATRKLLSPIKAIVALLNTINLYFNRLASIVIFGFSLLSFDLSLLKLWFSYNCISGFLEFLASPVNHIVRPIAEYLGISSFILTAAFLAIGLDPMVIGASIFSLIYEIYKYSKEEWKDHSKIMQNLPLPKEPVPEHIQEATNLVSKKATLSHQLFNTPKKERAFFATNG